MRFLRQPDSDTRLGDFLKAQLSDPAFGWQEFRASIAFVKLAGVEHLAQELTGFQQRGSTVRLSVGVDVRGTSKEGLEFLRETVTGANNRVWVVHNAHPARPTFHPKIYLLKKPGAALVIIGSGNLTHGGLFTNYEGNVALDLDLTREHDNALLQDVEAALDAWTQAPLALPLTPDLIAGLEARGLIRPERQTRGDEVPDEERDDAPLQARERAPDLFGSVAVPPAPARVRRPAVAAVAPAAQQGPAAAPVQQPAPPPAVAPVAAPAAAPEYFVLSVLDGDLPQPGSSNEIRIPKTIRDVKPTFWGWRDSFAGPDAQTGQFHRNIRVRFGYVTIDAYLKDFPARKPDGTKASADFRIGSIGPIVQSLNAEDDLIVLTRLTNGSADYEAQVINKSNPDAHELWADGMVQHTRARSTTTGTYKKYKYGP